MAPELMNSSSILRVRLLRYLESSIDVPPYLLHDAGGVNRRRGGVKIPPPCGSGAASVPTSKTGRDTHNNTSEHMTYLTRK